MDILLFGTCPKDLFCAGVTEGWIELTIKFTLLQVIYQDHEWEKGGKYDGTLQNVALPSGLAAMVIFSLLYSSGFRSGVVLEDYGSF